MSHGVRFHVTQTRLPSFVRESHDPVTIGRDFVCQIRLEGDSGVSRFHSRVDLLPDRVRILDLCSANGTFVNAERVIEHNLSDGDEIQCGQAVIRCELLCAHPEEVRETVLMRTRGGVNSSGDPLPETLGAYRVVQELGRGGMGRVLLAVDGRTRVPVAIKVLRDELIPPAVGLALFVREAAVLSKLRHPRIVAIKEFGLHEGRPYFVMEYVPVVDFDDILRRSSVHGRIRIACKAVARTLEALSHAHGLGYVHRDVKPSNLLAYYDASIHKLRVKLADFGLAKSFETAGFSGLTTSNEVRGTLPFMAPQQILDARAAGPSCDLYSCGATLYRLLSGRPPFTTRSAAETMAAVLNENPAPIEELVPELPAQIAEIVRTSMAKSLAERFGSAEDFRNALLAAIPPR